MSKKPLLSPGFFRFVIGFSAIILVSFGLLIFLGLESERRDNLSTPPPTTTQSE